MARVDAKTGLGFYELPEEGKKIMAISHGITMVDTEEEGPILAQSSPEAHSLDVIEAVGSNARIINVLLRDTEKDRDYQGQYDRSIQLGFARIHMKHLNH